MRLRLLRLPALVFALAMLDAAFDAPRPAEAAGSCNPGDCLANSAVNNRVQPTTVSTDDRGDVTFFASQSGQLPNVVLVFDNSTSMYELPYDTASFPNSSWVSTGKTPNGCGTVTTATTDNCTGTAFSATAATCGNNTFFKGLKDATGNPYSKTVSYAPPDPWYDGTHGTAKFFNNNDVFSFFEWAGHDNVVAGVPGGSTNAGFGIGFTSGTGVTGTVNAYCSDSVLSSLAGSGGKGGTGTNAWSMTQQQRCQQCIDEVGYYIAPAAGTNDNDTGFILFKGNWLNFYPPKYLIARKALTDFISRQSTTATPVRLGVVAYDPLNVNNADVPATSVGMAGRHDGGAFISNGMIPDCSVTTWTGAATQTQQASLITAVRGISFGDSSNAVATPLAETMFNVGQFLTGDNKLYQTLFTGGTSSDIWIKPAFTAPTGANKPLCVACQVSAVVLITDGVPFGDNNLPQRFRDNAVQCSRTPSTDPDPCGVDQNNGTPNLLDDVTNFLATTDLNDSLAGTQNAITYVLGMGLKVPLLDNAAKYGKTNASVRVNNGKDLQDQLASAVVNIAARSTAFSSAAVQTLQVGTGSTAFVPRFIPGSPVDPIWEGHLFRFDIFNEFVAGVDLNGDTKKDGIFLIDRDRDIVVENDTGGFLKQKNNQPAVPVWDAGAQLAATPAASRTIYTAVWDSASSAWRTLALPNWNGSGTPPADFTTVGNALGIDGTTACSVIQATMATPIPAAYLSSGGTFDRDHCIKAILDYVRGFNIRNEVLGNPSATINRPRMLGDIFHSSPVLVDPPVDQFFCDLGLHSQCLSTLYQYDQARQIPRLPGPIPSEQYTVADGTIGAYEKYWRDHETRKRIVLVGANDGMIHAFDAGSPTSSPPALDSTVGFRQVVYNSGTGNEVWAFIPPDQLPRLWLMLRGHQVYIDGDIMVRDIWVDGAQNDKGGAGFVNHPLKKQDVEYHTVAVAGERQGGNHFFALDVTDTTVPKMLWLYPPPCSDEEAMWGQSWAQFSPRLPPIGPLLLETTNSAGPSNYGVPHTEERYAVFLNGGHSPYLNRGRIASFIDAWTGAPLFVASYNPNAADTDPAKAMRFGFPAPGAMVDYGTRNQFEPDGIFDGAVLGDEGGQIWAFRMAAPGHIDTTTGLVNNWTFARAYEPNPGGPNDPRYQQPIYSMAATTVQDDTGWLRAYLGTGDRAHVRSQKGGDCRPDDPISCVTAGCTVSTSLQMDNASRRYSSAFASASGSSAASPAISSPTQSFATLSGAACNAAAVTETVQVSSCPVSAMDFTENTLSFSCSGSPLTCTDGAFPLPTPNVSRNYTTTPPDVSNSFVGIAIFSSGSPTRSMGLPADAAAYDAGRFSLGSLVDVTNTTADASGSITSTATAPAAGRSSPGWVIRYGTIDEKTVTSGALGGGCVLWNTLLPTGGATGCASAGANVAVLYQGDPVTGAPTCASSFISGGSYVRTIRRNVLAPPPELAPVIAIGAGGSSLQVSILDISPGPQDPTLPLPPGSVMNTLVQSRAELLQMIQSLPLTADQHVCRHVDPTTCK